MIGLAALCCCLVAVAQASFPDGITSCSRSLAREPYNECLRNLVQTLTPYLARGVRKMDLQPLDAPNGLKLYKVSIERGVKSLQIKANLTNILTVGMTNFIVEELDVDRDASTLTMRLRFPYVRVVRGNYDVQGRLLNFTLNGAGIYGGDFTNTEIRVNVRGKDVIDANGVTRIEIDQLQTKVHIGNGRMRLQAAKKSRQSAAKALENFFNRNPRLVLDIMSPLLDDGIAAIARQIAARVLKTFTKEEIVPQ